MLHTSLLSPPPSPFPRKSKPLIEQYVLCMSELSPTGDFLLRGLPEFLVVTGSLITRISEKFVVNPTFPNVTDSMSSEGN